jgi:hypothetical protein
LVQALWSPDGNHIAAWGYDTTTGNSVWLIDWPSEASRRIGTWQESMIRPLRWSSDGQRLAVIKERADSQLEWAILSLEGDLIGHAAYSAVFDTPDWLPNPVWQNQHACSHSGRYLAQIAAPRRGEQETWWTGPSVLSVIDTATQNTLAEKEITGLVSIVSWSLNDQWLLFSVLNVENRPCEYAELGPCGIQSSIWRLPGDGSSEMERITEQGFLLDIVLVGLSK